MEKQVNGSIRVKSSTNYTIEVNDEGDLIEFDLSDIGLSAKLIECYNNVQNYTKEFEPKEADLLEKIKKEQEENNQKETPDFYTESELEYINLQKEFYKNCRESMDLFLGKNACYKIFGDVNYPSMFLDLFEQLEPHFKKMGLNKAKMQVDLFNKYLKKKGKIN